MSGEEEKEKGLGWISVLDYSNCFMIYLFIHPDIYVFGFNRTIQNYYFINSYVRSFCVGNIESTQSGRAAAQGLLGKKCELLLNPKQMIPSWIEAGVRLVVARFFNQYISIGNLM